MIFQLILPISARNGQYNSQIRIQSLILLGMIKSTKRVTSEQNQANCLSKSQISDNQIECPICLEEYDLLRIIPMMICYNQHSTCNKCVSAIFKTRKCPVCCQKLIPRNQVKKNRLVSYMIQQMIRNNGQVLLCSNTYTYRGQMKGGKRHGMGSQITKQGTFLSGNFVSGQLSGKCQVITKNGARFQGQAKNGRLQGSFTTKYGSVIQGSFDIQSLSGTNCKKKYTNGDQYIGMINRLKANGLGKLTFVNGNIFQGSFIRDYISNNCQATISGKFNIRINNGNLQMQQIQQQIQQNPEQSSVQMSQSGQHQPYSVGSDSEQYD